MRQANHFSILALRAQWTVWKGKKIWDWKMNPSGQYVSNILLEKSGKIASEGIKRLNQSGSNAQLWMCLVVKVKSDAVKNSITQEPGMLGSWIKVNWKWSNRRWRVNINILEISELKWMEIGEFNSDDHYIYYCRQESLRKSGAALIVHTKESKTHYLGAISKMTDWSWFVSKTNHSASQ